MVTVELAAEGQGQLSTLEVGRPHPDVIASSSDTYHSAFLLHCLFHAHPERLVIETE